MVYDMNHVHWEKDTCEFRSQCSANAMNVRNIQKLLSVSKISFFPYAVTYVACITICCLFPVTTITWNSWRYKIYCVLFPLSQLLKKQRANITAEVDVSGSVHHSIILTEIANKIQQCIKIYYSMFIWSSTCFGRHTAHHQELKTALAASGFAYVKGCWTLTASSNLNVQQPFTYAKPEAASTVLGSWWWAVCRPKRVELHINME